MASGSACMARMGTSSSCPSRARPTESPRLLGHPIRGQGAIRTTCPVSRAAPEGSCNLWLLLWYLLQPLVAVLHRRKTMVVPDSVQREVLIDAPVEVVWSIVTEPEHIGRWLSD